MVLKMPLLMRLKYMPETIFQLQTKKYVKFLTLYVSNVNVRHYNTCGIDIDINLFDTVKVQKYLNFIASSYNFQSEEVDQVIKLLQRKKGLEEDLKTLESMSSEDTEMEKLIDLEKTQYLKYIQDIKKEILACILPLNNENDNRNVELQIISGIGGEESKLFSKELLQMYTNYSEYKNWNYTVDLINNCLSIEGDFVFGHLKYEAGVHRVQRVPETEKLNRIHTSTCSVIILPLPKPNEIQIAEKDLIIEKIKSSGPGGQNVNKRETCVRIKHIPSGVVVQNQTSRYQYENLKEAMLTLKKILFNKEQQKIILERNTLRKDQAGTNEYADKIRTYHYPQSRVTDHRLNYTTQNLIGVLSGKKELDYLIREMNKLTRREELLFHINNILNSIEYKNFEKQQN